MVHTFESAQQRPTVGGTWVSLSILVHVVMFAAIFTALDYRAPMRSAQRDVEPLYYIVPKDRMISQRGQTERLAMVALDLAGKGKTGAQHLDEKPPDMKKHAPDALVSAAQDAAEGKQREAVGGVAPAPTIYGADSVLAVADVDTAVVKVDQGAIPPYPQVLLLAKIEGSTTVRFVVDTTGVVDPATITVVASTHALFTASVTSTLPSIRYHPAKIGDRKVRQLVEQEFAFELVRRDGSRLHEPAPRDTVRVPPVAVRD